MTSTAPDSPEQARASADAWVAQGRASRGAQEHARAVGEACDPTPRAPACGVTSMAVPVDVPGSSHKAPPASVEVIGEAHVLAALAACRVATDRMRLRVVTRGRASHGPAVAESRRERMARVGALLGEASRLLDGEPDAVRERAKRALDRVG